MRAINASDCSRKTDARSSSFRASFGANLRQISKQNVSCVHKMHTNTTSMQAKPAEQAHIKKEKELTVLLEVQPRET